MHVMFILNLHSAYCTVHRILKNVVDELQYISYLNCSNFIWNFMTYTVHISIETISPSTRIPSFSVF